ncbi:MAG: zinc-ribbon domain-containing protein [Proteobacteria bacterium]|nr:zinc-ribbon domain-containing protein [Pseudomonadota bacterium]MBU1140132.1 zinc-ribbon domain-containing protein [Pseudomonadota bacterium]MBU1234293.1 zinc-ribbon domain-containing protein [Pseudomonadota bacterium]MBU1417732.1 zinc-ribbon domain-containing protein [Pseudomonadota bacterium]MBU1454928.1 zinc-ribbon domain-containing protein [Pseudomonadota bacterium]
MTITCPHCTKQLKISDKIRSSVQQLPPKQSVRLKCPQCENTIFINADSLTTATEQPTRPRAKQQSEARSTSPVKPPTPPDIAWLKEGIFEETEVIEDIPQALILIQPGKERDKVSEAVESIGYQPTFAHSAEDAMEKMQFINYAGVILHSQFEGTELDNSSFHRFMCDMGMQKRRFIFYILIGPKFFTLYDLEALANSANLVVNDREVPQLVTILRKAIPQYEELFGTLMAEINAYSG